MSLPPYKHRRNPCLDTEDEFLVRGLSDAPLITSRSVQEKRRTSDQRLTRIEQENLRGEFEYEYIPVRYTPPGSRENFHSSSESSGILKKNCNHDNKNVENGSVNFNANNKSSDGRCPFAGSGDAIDSLKVTEERSPRSKTNKGKYREVVKNGLTKVNDEEEEEDDAKSISSCSNRSLVSRCSENSCKTVVSSSYKERRESRKNFDSIRKSIPNSQNPGLKIIQPKYCQSRFLRFGKIANGLDDDDLKRRRC